MATKKLQGDLIIEALAGDRAIYIDSSGQIQSSNITQSELESVPSKIDSSEKDAANGVAALDGSGKLSSSVASEVISLDDLTNVANASGASSADQVLKYNGTDNFEPAVLNSENLSHAQADTNDWTIDDGGSVKGHLDEAGDRIATLESTSNSRFQTAGLSVPTANTPVNTGLSFDQNTDLSVEILAHVDADTGLGMETFRLLVHNGNPGGSAMILQSESIGGDSQCTFTITGAGVLQIESSNASTSVIITANVRINR